jgi:hypothetical protein
MERTTKFAALAALMVIIAATGLYISLATVSADDAESPDTQGKRWMKQRGAFAWRVVKNGVPVTLTGEVSALDGHIAVLNVDGSSVNVVMPGKWAADWTVLTTQDLFDGAPYDIGQSVNLHTLKAQLVQDTHSITCYVAYEIQVGDDVISAVLPFNIETE